MVLFVVPRSMPTKFMGLPPCATSPCLPAKRQPSTAISISAFSISSAARVVVHAASAFCHAGATFGRREAGRAVSAGPEPANRTVGSDVSDRGRRGGLPSASARWHGRAANRRGPSPRSCSFAASAHRGRSARPRSEAARNRRYTGRPWLGSRHRARTGD